MNIQTRGSSFEELHIVRNRPMQERVFNPNRILKVTVQQYYKEKNWEGLLNYLLLLENRSQLPIMWKWQVGQAYINNRQYQKSLDYLYVQHLENPDQPDIHLTILQALFELGKSEHSFRWIKKPAIQRVDKEVLTNCYLIISLRKSAIPLFILYSMIKTSGALVFNEFDLLYAIRKDNRFQIFNDTCFFRFSRIDLKAESLKRAA